MRLRLTCGGGGSTATPLPWRPQYPPHLPVTAGARAPGQPRHSVRRQTGGAVECTHSGADDRCDGVVVLRVVDGADERLLRARAVPHQDGEHARDSLQPVSA